MVMTSNPLARLVFPALLGAALAAGAPFPVARAAEPISVQDAHSIAVTAYLYFYSLVTMDLTRKQLTNVGKAEGIHPPMNAFANVPEYPTAAMKVVVRPNFDTLYSSAWLDLTKEPMIVSVPDTLGRRAHAVAGAITVVVARRRFLHLVSLRLHLGSVKRRITGRSGKSADSCAASIATSCHEKGRCPLALSRSI
jgi:hypothetical protein